MQEERLLVLPQDMWCILDRGAVVATGMVSTRCSVSEQRNGLQKGLWCDLQYFIYILAGCVSACGWQCCQAAVTFWAWCFQWCEDCGVKLGGARARDECQVVCAHQLTLTEGGREILNYTCLQHQIYSFFVIYFYVSYHFLFLPQAQVSKR